MYGADPTSSRAHSRGSGVPARLSFADLHAVVHVDAIPDELVRELWTLSCGLQCTLEWVTIYKGLRPTGACALEQPRHNALFRRNGRTIDVLSEALPCTPDDADRLCEALFRAFPATRRIHLDVVCDTGSLNRPRLVLGRETYNTIELPGTVEEYHASLGRSTRKTIRGYGNRLRRDHPDVATQTIVPGERSAEIVDQLVAWKIACFRTQGLTTYWEEEPQYIARVAALLRRRGTCRITTIDGRTAAVHICFRVGDTACALEGAHDPSYDAYRLGFLTKYETVCAAIADGATRFNAMDSYPEAKRLLGAQPLRATRLSVFRSEPSRLLFLKEAFIIARRRLRLGYQGGRHRLGQRLSRHPAGAPLLEIVRTYRARKSGKRHGDQP